MAKLDEAAIAQRAARLSRSLVRLEPPDRTTALHHRYLFSFVRFVARYHGSVAHGHSLPGIWDISNDPAKAGRKCYRCAAFTALHRRNERAFSHLFAELARQRSQRQVH